jgi:pyridoxal phosphate enzyme (YggS family)
MIAVTTEAYMARLAGTLPTVRDRIARAVSSADRAQGSVRMVAVTKSHPFAAVEAAIEAGLTDLGENRVEELEGKVAEFGAEAATWHMIGHLQSRKAVRASRVADVIHSIDSLRLAERISRDASADGGAATVLVQVNTSGESSKSGFDVAIGWAASFQWE